MTSNSLWNHFTLPLTVRTRMNTVASLVFCLHHCKSSTQLHVRHLGRCNVLQDYCSGVSLDHSCILRALQTISQVAAWVSQPVILTCCSSLCECCQNNLSLMPTQLNANFWAKGTRLNVTCSYLPARRPLPSFLPVFNRHSLCLRACTLTHTFSEKLSSVSAWWTTSSWSHSWNSS